MPALMLQTGPLAPMTVPFAPEFALASSGTRTDESCRKCNAFQAGLSRSKPGMSSKD